MMDRKVEFRRLRLLLLMMFRCSRLMQLFLMLGKLINVAVPGTIDERAINMKRLLNPWDRNENHTLCFKSAKAIGCKVVNIGTQDFIEGRHYLVVGLIALIIEIQLLADLNLKKIPQLVELVDSSEDETILWSSSRSGGIPGGFPGGMPGGFPVCLEDFQVCLEVSQGACLELLEVCLSGATGGMPGSAGGMSGAARGMPGAAGGMPGNVDFSKILNDLELLTAFKDPEVMAAVQDAANPDQ